MGHPVYFWRRRKEGKMFGGGKNILWWRKLEKEKEGSIKRGKNILVEKKKNLWAKRTTKKD